MAGHRTDGNPGEGGSLTQSLRAALAELLKAHQYAQETQHDLWDLSVSIGELQALGLTANDFRWLICKHLVAHAREITLSGDSGRTFRPEGGLNFSKRTCFILSDAGVRYACRLLVDSAASDDPGEPAPRPDVFSEHPHTGNGKGAADSPPRPHWDARRRELRLDGQVVKRFRVPAPTQELVLAAFEEEGWPARVDDPLPPQPEQNPKRRLSDTIKSLNQRHLHPLLRFHGDGCGHGVCWRIDPSVSSEPAGAPR